MKIFIVKTEDGERKYFSTRLAAQKYIDWWNNEYAEEFGHDSVEEMIEDKLAYIIEETVDD